MTTEIRCPWYTNGECCDGVLEKRGTATADMAIQNGVDGNSRTEYYVCAKCGRTFSRVWRWKLNKWIDKLS